MIKGCRPQPFYAPIQRLLLILNQSRVQIVGGREYKNHLFILSLVLFKNFSYYTLVKQRKFFCLVTFILLSDMSRIIIKILIFTT